MASDRGKRIEALRKQKGMSVRKLAQEAGVDYAHVHRICAGQNEPGDEVFRRLIFALGGDRISPDELGRRAEKRLD